MLELLGSVGLVWSHQPNNAQALRNTKKRKRKKTEKKELLCIDTLMSLQIFFFAGRVSKELLRLRK